MRLLTDEEESKLNELVTANPGLEVTPSILLGFLHALTANSGANTSSSVISLDSEDSSDEEEELVIVDPDNETLDSREDEELEQDDSRPSSRASSRGPSSAPRTPGRVPDSPFDSNRRQRSAPLRTTAAPSSWNSKRPVPSSRRRSDAGNSSFTFSDSEVCVETLCH